MKKTGGGKQRHGESEGGREAGSARGIVRAGGKESDHTRVHVYPYKKFSIPQHILTHTLDLYIQSL